MIPMIEREIIDKRGWFEKEDFRNQFTLAQASPGPIALNTAVFVGYRVKGYRGAVAAVLGSIIPSFTIILLIVVFLAGFKDNAYVEAAFKGIRPAVTAMIAVPFLKWIFDLKWYFIILAVAVALTIWMTDISPVIFILAGIIAGISLTFINSRK